MILVRDGAGGGGQSKRNRGLRDRRREVHAGFVVERNFLPIASLPALLGSWRSLGFQSPLRAGWSLIARLG